MGSPTYGDEPDRGNRPVPGSERSRQAGRAHAVLRRPRPHPVTRPWCGGPGTLFSWEVVRPGGAACGISGTEYGARTAVAEVIRRHGGTGIVQMCELGPAQDQPDQYAYGEVVAWARTDGAEVVWAAP